MKKEKKMKKKKSATKKGPRKTSARTQSSTPKIEANRRKEWRFELPLPSSIEGDLPKGEKFKESTTLENISAGGAYFCLDSGLILGTKINLVIDLPLTLTGGKKLQLVLGGITVRLEESGKKGKKQGVAIRFNKHFEIIAKKE